MSERSPWEWSSIMITVFSSGAALFLNILTVLVLLKSKYVYSLENSLYMHLMVCHGLYALVVLYMEERVIRQNQSSQCSFVTFGLDTLWLIAIETCAGLAVFHHCRIKNKLNALPSNPIAWILFFWISGLFIGTCQAFTSQGSLAYSFSKTSCHFDSTKLSDVPRIIYLAGSTLLNLILATFMFWTINRMHLFQSEYNSADQRKEASRVAARRYFWTCLVVMAVLSLYISGLAMNLLVYLAGIPLDLQFFQENLMQFKSLQTLVTPLIFLTVHRRVRNALFVFLQASKAPSRTPSQEQLEGAPSLTNLKWSSMTQLGSRTMSIDSLNAPLSAKGPDDMIIHPQIMLLMKRANSKDSLGSGPKKHILPI